jgi:hydroxymethylpyrimidine/phosphomethylpyrimidine kinase
MHFIPAESARIPQSNPRAEKVPVVLTIAGFDPSSGAGITADLKVFAAHGLFGVACVTALTVQSTQGVRRMQAVDETFVEETLACLEADIAIAGVKIGMLADEAVIRCVAAWLSGFRDRCPSAPVVLDPVLRASSGASLLAPTAIELLRQNLLPLVSVLTPNLAEARELSRVPLAQEAIALRANVPAMAYAIGSTLAPSAAVVITGGHLEVGASPDDYLLSVGEAEGRWLPGAWVDTRATHGTGCAFSSALLCGLVQGMRVPEATAHAKRYIEAALRAAYPVGRGAGPMHHLFALDAIHGGHLA